MFKAAETALEEMANVPSRRGLRSSEEAIQDIEEVACDKQNWNQLDNKTKHTHLGFQCWDKLSR